MTHQVSFCFYPSQNGFLMDCRQRTPAPGGAGQGARAAPWASSDISAPAMGLCPDYGQNILGSGGGRYIASFLTH